jgi:hypothetical protein
MKINEESASGTDLISVRAVFSRAIIIKTNVKSTVEIKVFIVVWFSY